jgi:hypothetical protein
MFKLVLKKFQNIPKEKFQTQVTNNFYTIFNPEGINTDNKEKRSASLKMKNSKRNEIEELRSELKEKNEFIKLLITERDSLNDKVKYILKLIIKG